jgi:8-oxo-dGTP pyrophosphatase MutT (NUDIX family)
MSREHLLTQLADYAVRFPQEQNTVQQFETFVRNHHDCFERSQTAGHVTGSAWLTNRSGTHVLLTHHRKLDRWLQLGGHADGNTDALDVALREATEESGIEEIAAVDTTLFDIDIHEIPARGNEPRHYHYDARFALQVSGTEHFKVSEESLALEWIKIDRLSDRTVEPSMLRMADKWIKRHSR